MYPLRASSSVKYTTCVPQPPKPCEKTTSGTRPHRSTGPSLSARPFTPFGALGRPGKKTSEPVSPEGREAGRLLDLRALCLEHLT